MKVFKNKKTRVFIIIMGTLVVFSLIIGYFYYDYDNKSIDPRIVEANILYDKYNELAKTANYKAIFDLMDTIENIYTKIPHYEESYEIGVLYNNRAASYIAMAINTSCKDSITKDSLLNLAKKHTLKSIKIYNNWIYEWAELEAEDIRNKIKPHFNQNDIAFQNKNIQRFINKRVKQIKESQFETPRRLSVSYTNLGIIYRHKNMFDEAFNQYYKALILWPDNLAAENNMNVLLDKPIKRRSILRRIFPKDRRMI